MLKVTIRAAAQKRGCLNANQFSESTGLARMVASRIWNNEAMPNLKTIEAICNAWGCDGSELLVIKADPKRPAIAKAQVFKPRLKSTKRRVAGR